jgi:predicted Zn finger-like uncharacterized protein
MTIKTVCPHCRQDYILGDAQRGQTVRCKNCDEAFVVRESGTGGRVPNESDDHPRPRRSAGGGGGVPVWVWLVGGGVLVLFLACLGGGGLVYWLATGPMRNRVTPENADRIRTGMTEAEVKAILGRPTEDSNLGQSRNPAALHILTWRNGGNQITVTFRNGKVTAKMAQFVNAGRK